MPVKVRALVAAHQCNSVARIFGEGADADLLRLLLREAIDERKWKHEAIAACWGVDPPYFARQLSGEKPISARHLRALPDDVEALFASKYAESFGLVVVRPLERQAAMAALINGLAGMLHAVVEP